MKVVRYNFVAWLVEKLVEKGRPRLGRRHLLEKAVKMYLSPISIPLSYLSLSPISTMWIFVCLLFCSCSLGNNDKMVVASGTGNIAELQALLKNGASPDAKGVDGWTPLTAAAKGGQLEAVKELIDNNAAIEGTDVGGGTALFWASAYGKIDIIEFLLSKGANVDHPSSTGNTPLMEASSRGQESAVKLLIERGASTQIKNNKNETAEDIATASGNSAVIALLRSGNRGQGNRGTGE